MSTSQLLEKLKPRVQLEAQSQHSSVLDSSMGSSTDEQLVGCKACGGKKSKNDEPHVCAGTAPCQAPSADCVPLQPSCSSEPLRPEEPLVKRFAYDEACPYEVYKTMPDCARKPVDLICDPKVDLGRGAAVEKMFSGSCLPPPLCLPPLPPLCPLPKLCDQPKQIERLGYVCENKPHSEVDCWEKACAHSPPVHHYPKVVDGSIPVCLSCFAVCSKLRIEDSCRLRKVNDHQDCMYCYLGLNPGKLELLGYCKQAARAQNRDLSHCNFRGKEAPCCHGKKGENPSCCKIPWDKSDFEVPFLKPSDLMAPDPASSFGGAPHHLVPEEALHPDPFEVDQSDVEEEEEEEEGGEGGTEKKEAERPPALPRSEPEGAENAGNSPGNPAAVEPPLAVEQATVGPRGFRGGGRPGPRFSRPGYRYGPGYRGYGYGYGYGLGAGVGVGLAALAGSWYSAAHPPDYQYPYDPLYEYYYDPYYGVHRRRARGYLVGGKEMKDPLHLGESLADALKTYPRKASGVEKPTDIEERADRETDQAPVGSNFANHLSCRRPRYYVAKPRRIGSKHWFGFDCHGLMDCGCCPSCFDYPNVYLPPYLDDRKPCPWQSSSLWWHAGENLRTYKPTSSIFHPIHRSPGCSMQMPRPEICGALHQQSAFVGSGTTRCLTTDTTTGIPCPQACNRSILCPSCKGSHFCSWSHSEFYAKTYIAVCAENGKEFSEYIEWAPHIRFCYCPVKGELSRLAWEA